MGRRLQLQALLEELIGSRNVYFQPPETVKLVYPCIIYSRSSEKTQFANDKPYTRHVRYKVTVVDPNPDSSIPERISALPMCSFDRHYTADNLNHDVYNLYY
jgi:hypothetical protein